MSAFSSLLSVQQPAQDKAGSFSVQDRMAMVVTLDRMAIVMTQLKDLLGDRMGQQGHLLTSNELGFDLTQSIFEMGVTQRIESLCAALESPHPEELMALLQTQGEVFTDLAESLNLPGFRKIAQTTLGAISQQPEKILQIAPIVLENLRSAQAAVLNGDRAQGGSPSTELQQFYDPTHPVPARKIATQLENNNDRFDDRVVINNSAPVVQSVVAHQPGWFKRQWQAITQPIGDTPGRLSDRSRTEYNQRYSHDSTGFSEPLFSDSLARSDDLANPASFAGPNPPVSEADDTDWEELTDTEMEYLDAELDELDDRLDIEFNPLPLMDISIGDRAEPTAEPLDSSPSLDSSNIKPLDPVQSVDQSSIRSSSHSSEAAIRMSVGHLDRLSQAMGELLTQQNRQALYNDQLAALIKKLLNRISQQQQQLQQQQLQNITHQITHQRSPDVLYAPVSSMASAADQLSAGSATLDYAAFDSLELDRYSDVQFLIQSVLEETVQQSENAEAIELFVRQSGQALTQQKRLLADTRETLLSARMVPLDAVFQRFSPAVDRLLKQYYPKQVDLVTCGGEVLIDRVIADRLYEPLLHLVRNAFDHGIESPEERAAQYKASAGQITIEGSQQGRILTISVRDNGRGLNLEIIRHKAVENGLMSATKAATLTPAQTIDLIFEAGFSTASKVDELSGRGVGLDAVREQARSLKGWVTVSHELGAGTGFTLHIPASLTIANLLLCQSKSRTYALITDAVEHILLPTEAQVRIWEGGKMLTWQAQEEEYLVPINALSEILRDASTLSNHRSSPRVTADRHHLEAAAARPVILLRDRDRLVGVEVDQLLGEQALVISPLGNTVVPPDYLYGSSLLPDGKLTLVLDGTLLAKRVTVLHHQNQLDLVSAATNSHLTKSSKEPQTHLSQKAGADGR